MPQPRRSQQDPRQPPPPDTQGIPAAAGTTAGATGAALITTGAVAAQTSQAIVTAGKVAAILTGMRRFFARKSQDEIPFIHALIRSRYPTATEQDIAAVVREEMDRETVFQRRALARTERDLNLANAITDERLRRQKIEAIMRRERRYVEQHQKAMADRVIAAHERRLLRLTSPRGAYWKMSPWVKEHTLDCLAMGGKFWPWAVLDIIHPPLHPGCPCMLYGEDEAKREGWLTPDFNPEPEGSALYRAKAAIESARRRMEEAYVEHLHPRGRGGRWIARLWHGTTTQGAERIRRDGRLRTERDLNGGGEGMGSTSVWLTDSKEDAWDFAGSLHVDPTEYGQDIGEVLAVDVALDNPFIVDFRSGGIPEQPDEDVLRERGYDGKVIHYADGTTSVQVFDPGNTTVVPDATMGVDATPGLTQQEIRDHTTTLRSVWHYTPDPDKLDLRPGQSRWGHDGVYVMPRPAGDMGLGADRRPVEIEGPFTVYEVKDDVNGSARIWQGDGTDESFNRLLLDAAREVGLPAEPGIGYGEHQLAVQGQDPRPDSYYFIHYAHDLQRRLREKLEAAGFDGIWVGGEVVLWNYDKLNPGRAEEAQNLPESSTSLVEARGDYDPRLHPRDRRGKWIRRLFHVAGAASLQGKDPVKALRTADIRGPEPKVTPEVEQATAAVAQDPRVRAAVKLVVDKLDTQAPTMAVPAPEPTVRLYHGTSTLSTDRGVLEPRDPAELASSLEDEFDLPPGSVLDHPAFRFSRDRARDQSVYFALDRRTAEGYAEARSEMVVDALSAAYRVIDPPPEVVDSPESREWAKRYEAWKTAWYAKHAAHPVVVALDVPVSEIEKRSPDWEYVQKEGRRRVANGHEPQPVNVLSWLDAHEGTGTIRLEGEIPLEWEARDGGPSPRASAEQWMKGAAWSGFMFHGTDAGDVASLQADGVNTPVFFTTDSPSAADWAMSKGVDAPKSVEVAVRFDNPLVLTNEEGKYPPGLSWGHFEIATSYEIYDRAREAGYDGVVAPKGTLREDETWAVALKPGTVRVMPSEPDMGVDVAAPPRPTHAGYLGPVRDNPANAELDGVKGGVHDMVRDDYLQRAEVVQEDPGYGAPFFRDMQNAGISHEEAAKAGEGIWDRRVLRARNGGESAPGDAQAVNRYEDRIRDRLRLLLAPDRAHVAVRIHEHNLLDFLENGYRNAIDPEHVDRGGAQKPDEYVQNRRAWEEQVFGDHPVYGYMGEPEEKVNEQSVVAFGDVKLVMDDRVRERTTFVFSDSNMLRPQTGYVIPRPVNDPDASAVHPGLDILDIDHLTYRHGDGPRPYPTGDALDDEGRREIEQWQQRIDRAKRAGDEMDESWARGQMEKVYERYGWSRWHHGDFFEAQIHGGVTSDDVKEVVWPANAMPDPAATARLDRLNIPWRIDGEEKPEPEPNGFDTGIFFHVTGDAASVREDGMVLPRVEGEKGTFDFPVDEDAVYLWPSRTRADAWRNYRKTRTGEGGQIVAVYADVAGLEPDPEPFYEFVMRPAMVDRQYEAAGQPKARRRDSAYVGYPALDEVRFYPDPVLNPAGQTLREWLDERKADVWTATSPSDATPDRLRQDPWAEAREVIADMPRDLRIGTARWFSEHGISVLARVRPDQMGLTVADEDAMGVDAVIDPLDVPVRTIPPKPTRASAGGDWEVGETRDGMSFYEAKADWEERIAAGIALGRISEDDAVAAGWTAPDGNARRGAKDGRTFHPMPERLWHATTALDAVKRDGILSQHELGHESGAGLGDLGSRTRTISLTDDPRVAQDIALGLLTANALLNGRVPPRMEGLEWPDDPPEGVSVIEIMYRYANAGDPEVGMEGGWGSEFMSLAFGPPPSGADRTAEEWRRAGFHDWDGNWKLQPILDNTTEVRSSDKDWREAGLPSMAATAEQIRAAGMEPSGDGWDGESERFYNAAVRPSTDDERRMRIIEMFRAFSLLREKHGGPEDPLIIGADYEKLEQMDPAQVGIVQVTPEPGSLGYQVGALGEWRTFPGAVRVESDVPLEKVPDQGAGGPQEPAQGDPVAQAVSRAIAGDPVLTAGERAEVAALLARRLNWDGYGDRPVKVAEDGDVRTYRRDFHFGGYLTDAQGHMGQMDFTVEWQEKAGDIGERFDAGDTRIPDGRVVSSTAWTVPEEADRPSYAPEPRERVESTHEIPSFRVPEGSGPEVKTDVLMQWLQPEGVARTQELAERFGAQANMTGIEVSSAFPALGVYTSTTHGRGIRLNSAYVHGVADSIGDWAQGRDAQLASLLAVTQHEICHSINPSVDYASGWRMNLDEAINEEVARDLGAEWARSLDAEGVAVRIESDVGFYVGERRGLRNLLDEAGIEAGPERKAFLERLAFGMNSNRERAQVIGQALVDNGAAEDIYVAVDRVEWVMGNKGADLTPGDLDRLTPGVDTGYFPSETAPPEGEWIWEDGPMGRVAVGWRQRHEELVRDALHKWKGWPSDFAIHDREARNREPVPTSGGGKKMRAQAEALRWEIEHNARPSIAPLFRGDNRAPEGVRGWSESPEVARHWADKGEGAVYELPAGTRGLRIADYVPEGIEDEREWIVDMDTGLMPGGEPTHVPTMGVDAKVEDRDPATSPAAEFITDLRPQPLGESGTTIYVGLRDGEPVVVEDPWTDNFDPDFDTQGAEDFVWSQSDWDLEGMYPSPDPWDDVWVHGYTLFHGTTNENAEAIREEGFKAQQRTGIPGEPMWPGVWLTADENLARDYATGPDGVGTVMAVDLGEMKADGYMPALEREPGIREREQREALAHLLGLEDFVDDTSDYTGVTEDTVIVRGDIPAKYVRTYDMQSGDLLKLDLRWANGIRRPVEGRESLHDVAAYAWLTNPDGYDRFGQFVHGARKASNDMAEKYPGIKDGDPPLREIKFLSRASEDGLQGTALRLQMQGSPMATLRALNKQTIIVNDLQDLTDLIESGGQAKDVDGPILSPATRSGYGCMVHEMGHGLTNAAGIQGSADMIAAFQEVGITPEEIATVSYYATAMPEEGFAEAFAMLEIFPDQLKPSLRKKMLSLVKLLNETAVARGKERAEMTGRYAVVVTAGLGLSECYEAAMRGEWSEHPEVAKLHEALRRG